MKKTCLMLFICFLITTLYSCRCWYKGGAWVVRVIEYSTSSPDYIQQDIIRIKYAQDDYSAPIDTYMMGNLNSNPSHILSFEIGDEGEANFNYVFIVGDTLRRDSVSDIHLTLKGPNCDQQVKSFDFLFNGIRVNSKEVLLQ